MIHSVHYLCLFFLCIVSCGSRSSSSFCRSYDGEIIKVQNAPGNSTERSFDKIDSISIDYSARNYGKVNYSKDRMTLSGTIENSISDRNTIDKFLGFVDTFMISKYEDIEYSRVKSKETVVTDYPYIRYTAFLQDKSVINGSLVLGQEGYDIIYNPKYTEFFQLFEILFDNDLLYSQTEEKPHFNGGELDEFHDWVETKLSYSQEILSNLEKDRIIVCFEVNSEGTVHKIEVLSGINSIIDDEVVKVISSSPKWIPGRQHGYPVNVKIILPIVFDI